MFNLIVGLVGGDPISFLPGLGHIATKGFKQSARATVEGEGGGHTNRKERALLSRVAQRVVGPFHLVVCCHEAAELLLRTSVIPHRTVLSNGPLHR